MATKRQDIESLVQNTMAGRDISSSPPADTAPGSVKFNPPAKRQVQIRFDPGDYEKLQVIAYRKGTKAAALIREAVKEIIKKNEREI
jgi:hypothetical protein